MERDLGGDIPFFRIPWTDIEVIGGSATSTSDIVTM